MILAIIIMLAFSILISFLKKHSFKQAFGLSTFNVFLVLVIIGIVGYPSLSQTVKDGLDIFNPQIQLIPFAEGFGISDLLNIFLFMPFGFLVAMLYKKGNSLLHVLFLGFSFSLLIEVSQMFTYYRISDMTDILTNTFGAALGFFVFKILLVKNDLQVYPIQMMYSFIMLASSNKATP